MRFLVLVHEDGGEAPGPPPAALLDAVGAFRADATHGRWLDDGGLAPPAQALWVRSAAGRSTVLDGPFAEGAEVVGGFFVVESASRDAMARWTGAFLDLHAAHWPELALTVEVRQIVDG